MTPQSKILKTANLIALPAPRRQNRWSTAARIPWELIDRLRDDLRAAGVPIDAQLSRLREMKKTGS